MKTLAKRFIILSIILMILGISNCIHNRLVLYQRYQQRGQQQLEPVITVGVDYINLDTDEVTFIPFEVYNTEPSLSELDIDIDKSIVEPTFFKVDTNRYVLKLIGGVDDDTAVFHILIKGSEIQSKDIHISVQKFTETARPTDDLYIY